MKKDRVRDKFIEELKKMPNISVACKHCNISRNSIYQWRDKDPYFASLMDEALLEGDEFVNDMCDSKLLTLVNEGKFNAIKFKLEHCHPKYMKKEKEVVEDSKPSNDEIIKILGLTAEDFIDDKIKETRDKIHDYLWSL
ncbi:hypothetical protein KKC45_01050 [Patescibacteria group bacterium]|nr:hypothetical protein [Patescibacteria group bacterium]